LPVTSPEELTVATEGVAEDQVPPPVAFDNDILEPTHTFESPVMAAGTGLMLIVVVT
jgi:hypothetical protein